VGFAPLTFRVFVRLTNVAVAEYTTKPRSDENGRPLGQPADVLAPARTALLLGRRVSLGADGLRWQFDDGSLAFENLSQHVPDAFFDIPTKPAGSVSVAPADIDRTSTLMTDIVRLLKTTNVRYDTGFLGDWGEHGRLCFEDTGMIRCANHNALDYDNTGVNDHSVSFKCRADSLCAFMAAPWNESRRLGKVRLKDQDRQLTAQAGLFVNGLPSQEAAETLAARIRELAGLDAKYRDTVR
jgi:hypothetical protein